MELQPPAPHRRDLEGKSRYAKWRGIQPLAAEDRECAFTYENDWGRYGRRNRTVRCQAERWVGLPVERQAYGQ